MIFVTKVNNSNKDNLYPIYSNFFIYKTRTIVEKNLFKKYEKFLIKKLKNLQYSNCFPFNTFQCLFCRQVRVFKKHFTLFSLSFHPIIMKIISQCLQSPRLKKIRKNTLEFKPYLRLEHKTQH